MNNKANMGRTKNEILIGGFNAVNELRTEEIDYKYIADCDVDFILLSYLHDEKSDFNVSMLEKYGVKAFIYDPTINGKDPDTLTDEYILQQSEPYRHSSGFLGFGIIDEPSEPIFPSLGKTVAAIRHALPDSLFHINLLPWYAYNNTEVFRHYLDSFVENIDINHVSTDDYPLALDETGKKTTNYCFYMGLYESACVARDSGREHWQYIYSYSKTAERGYRCYTQNDFFFQAYSHLAFGASKLLYFCFDVTGYRGPNNNPDLPYCMRNHARGKTELWDYAKVLNGYMHALSDVYSRYEWTDVGHVFGDANNTEYLKNLKAYTDDGLTVKSSSVGLVIGSFKKQQGEGQAWMMTNASEISDEETAHVTFTVPGTDRLFVHMAAKTEEILPDANGTYTLDLAPGMGAFLTKE